MDTFAIRFLPGQDLKAALDGLARREGWEAACVLTCVGSLTRVSIRFANQPRSVALTGHYEIVSLSGALSRHGSHLHIAVCDETGQTTGGHLKESSLIYTTAEIVLGILPGWRFLREHDPATGYAELTIHRTP